MDDVLEIPVTYKGEELIVMAKVILAGYGYKFQIEVDGQEVLFEPDEERNFRAMLNYDDLDKGVSIDKHLLKAIADVLNSFTKE
jgi:hypothetical protein